MDLKQELKKRADFFNEQLEKFLSEGEPETLYDAARHLPLAGGKRIRPALAMVTCEAVKGDIIKVIPLCIGVEIIHSFTLVHDDIMDKSKLRRNIPAVHIKFGEPTAIMAGDLLFAKAFESMHNITGDCSVFKNVEFGLIDCVKEICEGQQLDVEFEQRKIITEEKKKAFQRSVSSMKPGFGMVFLIAILFAVSIGVALWLKLFSDVILAAFIIVGGIFLAIFIFASAFASGLKTLRLGGREGETAPKLLIDNSKKGKAPFIDATGARAGALLGDCRHDPYQSGGLGTPAQFRVEAGMIHKAHGGVLFIDEVHRLNHVVEEILYPAMEDNQLDIIIGQGPSARTMKIPLPPFTLVGATTRTGLLTPPLRDRFGVIQRVEFYQPEDLQKIISRSADILEIPIQDDGALELAKRSRGTPRVANRILRRVRDYAQVEGDGIISREIAMHALDMLNVDNEGLDKMDRHIMLTIINKFDGGPIGLDTLSAAVCEEKDTLEDVYEPFLIQKGYIKRTPRGRVATKLAYNHFKIQLKEKDLAQKKLF